MTLNEAIAEASNYPIKNHRTARFDIDGRTYKISEISTWKVPSEANQDNYEVVAFLTRFCCLKGNNIINNYRQI